jgi:hypothetical protein
MIQRLSSLCCLVFLVLVSKLPAQTARTPARSQTATPAQRMKTVSLFNPDFKANRLA